METQVEPASFRSLLREELVDRCKRNPAYSARALARDLRISAPFLCQVLGGKRRISERKSHDIADRLGWDVERRRVFTGLVRYENADGFALKESILLEIRGFRKAREILASSLRHDYFAVVADWHHTAIAELTHVEGFKAEPRWIAARLGIPVRAVRPAIERLKRVGMLVEDNGTLRKAEPRTRVADVPSSVIRGHHRQLLEKAIAALESQAPDERDITGTTIAINPRMLPKAKELIRNFRWELMELLETGPRRAVYQLSVQLFRLEEKACVR